MKIKITSATGSTQDKEPKVIQVDSGTKSVEVDLKDLPVELQFTEQANESPVVNDSDTTLEIPSDSSATPIARLTKQTGTHLITTTNGFNQTGTMEELASALTAYPYNISLTFEDEVMIFENRNMEQIDVEITAQGRSGKTYVTVEQDNNAIALNGKNAKFRLAGQIAQPEPDSVPEFVG